MKLEPPNRKLFPTRENANPKTLNNPNPKTPNRKPYPINPYFRAPEPESLKESANGNIRIVAL